MNTATNNLLRDYKLPSTICSQCSATAHFTCLNHCSNVFCGRCSIQHRVLVTQQMTDLIQKLKQCHMDPITTQDEIDLNFLRASQQTLQRTRDTVNNLITEIQQREETVMKDIEKSLMLRQKQREKRTSSGLLTSDEAHDYTHLLNDFLKRNQLISTETMSTIQRRLDARNTLGQSIDEVKAPIIELGKFNIDELLRLRFAPRTDSSLNTKQDKSAVHGSTTVTIHLEKRKTFPSPFKSVFSIGRHPIVISLNDQYSETFFCRRSDNSLILLSTTSIDVINRGSGLESSIRLSKIFGTTKDKILAGTWCEHSQRLILNGNHHMYFFNMQRQQHADRFRCETITSNVRNASRFLGCTHDGSIIYAYKSDSNIYTIVKLAHPVLPSSNFIYTPIDESNFLLRSGKDEQINGHIAAVCITNNHITIIYRRLQSTKHVNHYMCLFNHDFTKQHKDDLILPPYIKWVTSIAAFGNDDYYLLCDPRGQQLLFYRSSDGVLTRRFRIGAINACFLTDGKLVLWLQKQYSSSPTGKLHFITPPHLEKTNNVSNSFPLLYQS